MAQIGGGSVQDDAADDVDNIEQHNSLSTDKKPSILPEITDELLELHQAESAEMNETSNQDDKHKQCCGIPIKLMLALIVLSLAVVTGTVLLVIYYEPDKIKQSPPSTPTASP